MKNGYPPELRGDGRRRVIPIHVPPGTQPLPLSRSKCRQLIDVFEEQGMRSNHSPQGGTVWVILYFCHWAELPYTLTYCPGLGYTVHGGQNDAPA